MGKLAAMPRSDRGPKARKAITVLLRPDEKDEIERALRGENQATGRDLGLGSKLRELGLVWARGQVATGAATVPKGKRR